MFVRSFVGVLVFVSCYRISCFLELEFSSLFPVSCLFPWTLVLDYTSLISTHGFITDTSHHGLPLTTDTIAHQSPCVTISPAVCIVTVFVCLSDLSWREALLKGLTCYCIQSSFLVTALQHQRVRPNGMAILPCGDLKVGKVTWSRDMNGHQVYILSTDNGEIIRHMNNNSHSSLPDLSLIIWFASFWDEGLYYCNGTPVACLTVKPADGQNTEDLTECLKGASYVNVTEQVLMFGGVGLAALMFLFATAAAVQALYSSDNVKQRAHTTDHVQTSQTDLYYINLREQ